MRNGITLIEDGNKFEKDKSIRSAHYQRMGSGSNAARHNNGSSSRNFSPRPSDYKPKCTSIRASLDISHATDFELSSNEEKQLFATSRILTKPYLLSIDERSYKE